MKATNEKNENFQVVWFDTCFMYIGSIVSQTEKAYKLNVKSYVCYPGVRDSEGSNKGFLWIPKSACEQKKEALEGSLDVKKWFDRLPKKFLRK